jgi:putative ABC transport system permease protein
MRAEIDRVVGADFNLFVLSNRDFKSSVIEAIDQVFGLAVALEVLTLVIAIIGIVNNLLSNVIDRTREIGVLRSLGATRLQVRRIFLFQSGLMGFTGALVGLFAGWAVGMIHIKRLSQILSGFSVTTYFSVGAIIGAFALAVVFAALAGLVPAAKAANLSLHEALKYE